MTDQSVISLHDRDAPLPDVQRPYIAYGNGRSYGDVCLNEGGCRFDTQQLDHFIGFDRQSGRLCCEAGVLLSEILDLVVPQGWFLAVTPGTCFVTVGGAIANDVHGKNHHVAGSFGAHVLRLALRRSDGELIICGPEQNSGWFAATVGGLGLTGIVLWAEIQLQRIESEAMTVRTRRFRSLDEFWEQHEAACGEWPYTVAWIDCGSAKRAGGGRGIHTSGEHDAASGEKARAGRPLRRIGLQPPFSLIRPSSVRLFNRLYFHRGRDADERIHYRKFFYPLDALLDWNLLYGPRGFFQYQCVLPKAEARATLATLLRRIADSREESFLAVVKTFGDMSPVGLLSFARPGVTLAVDFANRGRPTQRLLEDLDAVVLDAGGALYPAKDARMSARMFHQGFPRIGQFVRYLDPMASSSFWRRVTA